MTSSYFPPSNLPAGIVSCHLKRKVANAGLTSPGKINMQLTCVLIPTNLAELLMNFIGRGP